MLCLPWLYLLQQVQALSSALGLRLRVEYLDSSAMPWSNRAGMHRLTLTLTLTLT